MKQKAFIPICLGLVIYCYNQCSTVEETVKREINPPFMHVNVPYDQFRVDPVRDELLHIKSGTVIHIPAGCFTDNKGNRITEPVEISYREFHNAASILTSGIPMKYDSAGKVIQFETAGMFEIKGSVRGIPVNIAENKSIRVDMASYQEEDDYNFYYFNKESGNWEYKGKSTVTENRQRADDLAMMNDNKLTKPLLPEVYDPSKHLFDLDINYRRFPELKVFNGIMWQYAQNEKNDTSEILPDPNDKKWLSARMENHSDIPGVYNLTLQCSDKKYTVAVKPVLRGKSLQKAKKEFQKKMEEYNVKLEERNKKVEQLSMQAKIYRAFEINDMGIYNHDKPYYIYRRVEFEADYDFGINKDYDLSCVDLFLITGKRNNVVFYFTENKWNKLLVPVDENKLIAVLPGNRISVFTAEDFDRMNLSGFQEGKVHKYTFHFKPVKEKITSFDQLQEIIASL